MKKQNIEDIFSSMENFSSVPPPELWDKIEEQLEKPKKKKRAIIWWSAAACLLMGLLIPSAIRFASSDDKALPNGVIENNNVVLEEKGNSKTNSTTTSTEHNNNQVKEKAGVSNIQNKTEESNATLPNQNNATVVLEESKADKTSNKKSNFINRTKVAKSSFSNNNKNSSYATLDNKNKTEENTKKNTSAKKSMVAEKQTLSNGFGNNPNSNSIFNESLISRNNPNNNAFALNSSNQNKANSNQSSEKPGDVSSQKTNSFNQKSNNSSVVLLTAKDSVQLAELHTLEKSIDNPKKEKEDKKDPLVKTEKWSVQVFAGIANSENYKNEKTLGNTNSSKQSNAYGIKTNYKLNKKWAVSSGLKINELGQSIANVSYLNSQSITYKMVNSYAVSSPAAAPQISNNSNYVFVAKSSSSGAQNSVLPNTAASSLSFESGDIDQRLKYIEMPFEVSYFLLNKNKTSVSLNTGGFVGKLISNDVYLNGNAIGDNINANDFVYGSVLSSTLQYSLYKKTKVFVEPGMNYYVNPLNNQSFNQFQWSFNFGLNVSF